MDLKELKGLFNNQNERLILVENGEPSIVVLSYQGYQKLVGNPANQLAEKEEEFEPDFDLPDFDFAEEESEADKNSGEQSEEGKDENEDEEPFDLTEDFLGEDVPEEQEKGNPGRPAEPEKIDGDVSLDPEAKKELTLDDLPF